MISDRGSKLEFPGERFRNCPHPCKKRRSKCNVTKLSFWNFAFRGEGPQNGLQVF